MSQLEAIINEILDDSGRAPISSLSAEMRLREDLGLNSLELAVLTVRLEAVYGVDVFASGLVTTVGEVLAKLPPQAN
ncbi:MAG: acyl carrier protein [Planctomycetota bacterium]|jgi:acyl carrier protein